MHRRKFIAVIPGLVAGTALLTRDNDSDGPSRNNDMQTDDDSGEFRRTVSVKRVDSVPEHSDIELDINVDRDTVTPNQSAILNATVSNLSDETIEVLPAYYKGKPTDDSESGILLYSLRAGDSPGRDYAPDCIDDPSAEKDTLLWTTEQRLPTELPPGESLTEELVVVDDPTVDGCIPSGEYRFEEVHSTGEQQSNGEQFEWGFTLEVTTII